MNERIVVLHTNDLHSHFEQMPRIATGFRELEAKHQGTPVLRIDCGDHMDRMRMETEGTRGQANIEIMNATGYEYFVPGNNEGLTFPLQYLAEDMEQAAFKVLGTNVSKYKPVNENVSELDLSWLTPMDIVTKGSLRIGLIGVTAPFNDFYHNLGVHMEDPIQSISKAVDQLRSQTDLLFVISHLGLPSDKKIAENVSGIDCIFGAHTHHLLEQGLEWNGTLICAAGKFGQYIGEVIIDYDPQNRQVTEWKASCFHADQFDEDREMKTIISRHQKQASKHLNHKVTDLQEPLPNEPMLDAPLSNLLVDGLRDWMGTELALVNTGQLLDGLEAGPVTLRDLLEVCPSPINPCRLIISGAQILQSLEEALLDEFTAMPIKGFGFRGKVLGSLSISGIEVAFQPDRKDYHKVMSVFCNGLPLDVNKDYWLGTIDMFTFGCGYKALQKGKNPHFYLPEFLRDILSKQLRDEDALKQCWKPRWLNLNKG